MCEPTRQHLWMYKKINIAVDIQCIYICRSEGPPERDVLSLGAWDLGLEHPGKFVMRRRRRRRRRRPPSF